jgi:hypothetical protein
MALSGGLARASASFIADRKHLTASRDSAHGRASEAVDSR